MQRENETIDELSLGHLRLLQAEDGYRFSLDPVLLARFVAVGSKETVVDLGTGCGVIPLLLAKLSPAQKLVGVELQAQLAERAKRNVVLNDLRQRVQIIEGDVRNIRELLPHSSVDLVVANPPYRQAERGRIAPQDERAAARHELAGGLTDFLAATRWLLKNRGRLAIIYLAERLPELLSQMQKLSIEPKRLRLIHPRQGEAARMVMVEGRMAGRPGLQVDPPLYVYQGAGRDYTDEILAFYANDPAD